MFVIKSLEEIGSNLKKLILKKYKSVRNFCIHYLKLSINDSSYEPDLDEIRNLSNRFSQIINGRKAIQTYDLPIISHLLGVSCEDILSCGSTKVPLSNRRTNYNIAFSTKESDWDEYFSREDCIAAYADEFGKTVLDYAIDFQNYKFIKYLIDKEYIRLVYKDPSWDNCYDFGAKSCIAERIYDHKTVKDEFYTNKLLRTQILALAIVNNDVSSLKVFRAREIPPQLGISLFNIIGLSFKDYYDDNFVKEIAKSTDIIFDWFLEEYPLKVNNGRVDTTWVYPFIGELAVECIKLNNKDRINKILEVIFKHNKDVFLQLHKEYLYAAKKEKEDYRLTSFKEILENLSRDYQINNDKNFVSFCPYYKRSTEPIGFNIVKINFSTKDLSIQNMIDEINDYYEKILNLPSKLINDN